MANKFVRSTREVKDVNKLSDNVAEENDILSQTDGKVFIKTRTGGYLEIGGSGGELDPIKQDVTNLKSENTKLKKRVTDLETQNDDFETRITALETVEVTGVTLDKSTLSLEVGATATLKATVKPSNATYKDVKFTSSDKAIATVDDKGKVTAVKAGTADITVESLADGSKTAKCTLTVTKTPAE